jgi:uncharacterized protein involved in exopolysaccharide biosynthesis
MAVVNDRRDAERDTETVSAFRHRDQQESAWSTASIADFFAQALWNGRWILILAAALGAVGGGILGHFMQPVYEASATLLITESREPEAVNSPETLRAIADSNSMATRVLAALKLDGPPYYLTPDTFRARDVAVEELRGSRMVRVTVTLPDAALAARGADEVARQTVELARTLNQQDTTFLRDYLAAQLDAAQTRKGELEREMVAYRASSQLELVETDADALLQQRSELPKLVIDIAAEESRLATAERELAQQDRILKAPRRAEIEGALARLPSSESEQRQPAARAPEPTGTPQSVGTPQSALTPQSVWTPQSAGTPQSAATPQPTATPQSSGTSQSVIQRHEQADEQRLRRPAAASPDQAGVSDTPPIPPEAIGDFVNPVYEILDYQAAVGRSRLAALRKQRDELIRVRKVDAQQLQTLSTMYRTQIELRKLQTEYDLAEKIYLDLSMKHEQARVQAVSSSSHVQLLDPAVRPTEPVAPRKRRIAAVGAVAGLLLAVTGVIFAAALRSRRQTVSAA